MIARERERKKNESTKRREEEKTGGKEAFCRVKRIPKFLIFQSFALEETIMSFSKEARVEKEKKKLC